MEQYPSVVIHFTEQSLMDEKMPLKISPKPDTAIRVFMQWRKHEDGKIYHGCRLCIPLREGGMLE